MSYSHLGNLQFIQPSACTIKQLIRPESTMLTILPIKEFPKFFSNNYSFLHTLRLLFQNNSLIFKKIHLY